MKASKRKKLNESGWRVADASEFLDLTDQEQAYIEMKLALSQTLKIKRRKKRLSQSKLAQLIDSSQSRVAKMEAADPSVSIDLLVKSLLAMGATQQEVAKAIRSGNA